ncbi:MAG: YqjF family protein [Chthoniobacterales bacterium]
MKRFPDLAARLAAREPDGERPVIMHQRWEALLFLHWTLSPETIQATLPKGLTVDTHDSSAYLGLSPFFMRNLRPVGLPALPWLSEFQELNVRTYVYDEQGVPGIWFYSLDCNQPLAVAAARLATGLPYFNAEMKRDCNGMIDYSCRRDGTEEVARYRYRGTGASREGTPHSLEFFLLERYYLYSVRGETLIRSQVSHIPYRFRAAEVEHASANPARLDGFTEMPDAFEHACFVDGFDVEVYGTRAI